MIFGCRKGKMKHSTLIVAGAAAALAPMPSLLSLLLFATSIWVTCKFLDTY